MITRRDFLSATLLGSGAALLRAAPPRPAAPLDASQWDGPEGAGDYASSQGIPAELLRAVEVGLKAALDLD